MIIYNAVKLLGVLLCFVIILSAIIGRKNKSWIVSPGVLFGFFFCLPYLISLLKLSDLQDASWSQDTYILVLQGIFVFGIIPIFLSSHKNDINLKINSCNISSKFNRKLQLVFFSFALQLIINKSVSGYFFPAFYIGNISDRFHTTEGVGFVATWGVAVWYVVSFSCFADGVDSKDNKSYILFAVILIAPLTRLARFDIISVGAACAIYWSLKNTIKVKNIIYGFFGVCIISLFGAFVAKYRWGGGDAGNVSFADSIGYNSYAGPFDVFAFLYAYYPLSFENIDRIIDPAKGELPVLGGAAFLQPITVGILKLHNIFPGLEVSHAFDDLRDPIHGLATVPTALPIFALDFGLSMAWIPMLFYSAIGVFLFNYANKSQFWARFYALYAIGYIHFPFLNHFVQPLTGVILALYFATYYFRIIR